MQKRLTLLALSASILLCLADVASAQDANTQPRQAQPASQTGAPGTNQGTAAATLSTIVVTGTRARNVTEEQSLTPIDVIPGSVLRQSGATNLIDALQLTLPSLSTTFSPTSDTGAFQQQVTLRGLAPDEVLVLVNGKRWHPGAILVSAAIAGQGSQGVDLRTIPLSAIDHIEVLRDSASAQYGSDAIAGVVNVILKGGAQGGDVNVMSGKYSAGDGQTWKGTGNFGVPLGGDRGWMRVAVDYDIQDPTNRAGLDRRVPYIGKTWHLGLLYTHNENMMMNSQFDITPNVQFYAFGHFGKFTADPPGFYRYGFNTPFPNNPLMKSVYPDGFLPHEHGVSLDRSLVAGLRGKVGLLHWDISANHGDNRIIYATLNTINYAYLRDFGIAQRDFHDGTLKAGTDTLDADFTYDIGDNWGLAFGAQWLRDSYEVQAGELGSYYVGKPGAPGGAQGFAGWSPQEAVSTARHALSEYVQLQGNITEKLTTSLAVRHENYSDFGSNTSYGGSLRYDFTPRFALRASVSSGFHAPSLTQEEYSEAALSLFDTGNSLGLPPGIYLRGLVPVSNPIARLMGAEPLQPEKSHSYTVGMVWSPAPEFNMTVDAYQVTIGDLIARSSVINTSAPAVLKYLAANGIAAPEFVGISYFTNAASLRVQGIDVVGFYTHKFQSGNVLNLSLGTDYHKNKVFNVAPNPAVLDQFGNIGFQRLARPSILGLLANTIPRMKIIASSDYRVGNWGFHVDAVRFGRVTTYASNPATSPDLTLNARWHVNASVSYNYLDHWRFTVGADNVFNVYPQRLSTTQDLNGVFPFQSNSPGGYQGSFIYVKAGYRW